MSTDKNRTDEVSNKDEDQEYTFYAYGFEEDGDGEYFTTSYTYDVTVPPEAYIVQLKKYHIILQFVKNGLFDVKFFISEKKCEYNFKK